MRYGYDMQIDVIDESETQLRSYQEVRLYYVLDGQLQIEMEGKLYRLETGDILVVNSNMPHTYSKYRTSLTVLFQISKDFLTELTKNPIISFSCSSLQHESTAMSQLRGLLKRTLHYRVNTSFLDKIREYGYCCDVLECLIKNFSVWNMAWNQEENQEGRLEEILSYIQANYEKPLNLQVLADKFFLSVPYLSKYIKHHLGMGFLEYMDEIRLYHAVDELVHTDFSLTKIAYDNGFPNLSSFNRAFRQKYETTPSLYRKTVLRQQERKNRDISVSETASLLRQYFQDNPLEEEDGRWKLKASADGSIRREYRRNWLNVLNLGPAEELRQGYIQEHIVELKQKLGFMYGRVWNLFCKENLIDLEREGNFHFSALFQMLDFMLENKIIPFLVLAQKPRKLVNPDLKSLVTEDSAAFVNLARYKKVLTRFMKECISRYGVREVETWRFECWWDRRDIYLTDVEPEWMERFRMEWDCIKSLVPKARIGGLGFNVYDANAAIESYLKNGQKENMRLDFLSVSLYPYGRERNLIGNKVVDENFVERELGSLKTLLAGYGSGVDQLYVTEWNLSISGRDWLNDTCYKGAYLMKNLIAAADEAACIAYWGNTDRSDEYFDFVGCLNGGSGLISRDGIRKPAFYALNFMSRLARNLVAKGDNYMITSTNHGSYFIVCHNMQPPDFDYYLDSADRGRPQKILSYFGSRQLQIDFTLCRLKADAYRLRRYYVNQEAGSVFDEWAKMGYVESVDLEEIEYLKLVSVSRMQTEVCQTKDGEISFRSLMQANEIQLIHLTPML